MKYSFVLAASLSCVAAPLALAQARPAVRKLGAIEARSKEPLGSAASVRTLPGGKLLVNDVARRRVLLFDGALSAFTVVADSTSATANAYSGRSGGLIAYRGDSSLFVDPASMSMLVIDPAGKVARVMSVPRSEDAVLLGSPVGGAAFDSKGRLLYRGALRRRFSGGGLPGGGGGAPFAIPEPPDSAPIFRIDLQTRKLDTVAFIKTPKVKIDVSRDSSGGMTIATQVNPLPVVDDWAVLSDGSLAIVRGRDYHVDFINSEGAKVSAPKIPFEWQRLTDEDKVAFIDSLKVARERMGPNAPGVGGVPGFPGAGGASGEGGGMRIEIGTTIIGGGGSANGAPRPGPARTAPTTQVSFVAPADLPDYKPAFFGGSARADAQGNLWIRTIPTSAIAGGPVYDVINRQGKLVERVQIPAGRTIIAFGADGAVFLSGRENNVAFVERARVR